MVGTDAAHKIKLLALEINPSIPGLAMKPKPKLIWKKFNFHACKGKLKEIDFSLV